MTDLASPFDHARHALVAVLKEKPLLGAQLKPRLQRALVERGIPPSEALTLFPKFVTFLDANADLVEVLRQTSGDVMVKLKSSADPSTPVTSAWDLGRSLRPELWQAIINPDPNRRRFFHRRTGEILHYRVDSQTSPNPEITRTVAADNQFVEIPFAQADRQTQWMREFVASEAISPWNRKTLEHLMAVPFESSVNSAFTLALPPANAENWRQFRFRRVLDLLDSWARERSIDRDVLRHGFSRLESMPPSDAADRKPSEGESEVAIRTQLHRLVDSATTEELSQFLIPAGLLSKLAR